ncbi:MAG: ABC transporter ATP-binding protein [Spirochaetaceae bacterium]
MTATAAEVALSVQRVAVAYTKNQYACRDVSFELRHGDTFGIVGESGAGKSSVLKAIAGQVGTAEGRIVWDGQDLATLSGRRFRSAVRARQLVPQDHTGALNPRISIGASLRETRASAARISEIMNRVGLSDVSLSRRPGTLSGGQRQRVCIARALLVESELLLLDEPTSSLDASVAASLLHLLHDLRSRYRLSMVVVSHDLDAITALCGTIGVMKDGSMLEQGRAETILARPAHEYTRQLLEAVPRIQTVPDRNVWNAWE